MKHAWEAVRKTQATFLCQDKRKCRHCGVVQERGEHRSWGRVIRRYWFPLAGRCRLARELPAGKP